MQITDEMRRAAWDRLWECYEAAKDIARGPDSASDRQWADFFRAVGSVPEMARVPLTAALSPPPAGATVPVRVAVAFTEEGQIAAVDTIYFGQDETAWKALAQEGAVLRSCIATIHAPVPAVPEVTATIEGTAP